MYDCGRVTGGEGLRTIRMRMKYGARLSCRAGNGGEIERQRQRQRQRGCGVWEDARRWRTARSREETGGDGGDGPRRPLVHCSASTAPASNLRCVRRRCALGWRVGVAARRCRSAAGAMHSNPRRDASSCQSALRTPRVAVRTVVGATAFVAYLTSTAAPRRRPSHRSRVMLRDYTL